MQTMLYVCILFSLAATASAELEGFVVGGSLASITDFPHAAFLAINCVTAGLDKIYFSCGSSVFTQQLVLTAAHCVIDCTHPKTSISINMGNENKLRGVRRYASDFVCHERFNPHYGGWDIAIVKMSRPVRFNLKIQRVAIMMKPPYHEPAWLAGWGLVNEDDYAIHLKKLYQTLWDHKRCIYLMSHIPQGTFCASNGNKTDYPSSGDSGSGLVVRNYIQIGLVSFKYEPLSKDVVVYTDVGYHYKWIEFNARRICAADGI